MVRDIRHHFGSQQQLAEQALEYLHALADSPRTLVAMRRAADGGLGALDEDGRLVIDSGRIADLEGVLRCYVGCALYLSGDLGQDHIVRLDPLRRRTTLFALDRERARFPKITTSTTIDLRRQDVSVRTEDRVLVRKTDVFGMAQRSKQRVAERERRMAEGREADRVLVRT